MSINTASAPETPDAGVERNVVTLGWVAFFGGLAQDMIQPVLPVFYSTVLGLNKEFIGLIEGLLTSAVSFSRIGAGYLSDALGMRKAIVFVGYALSAIGRFGLGLAGSGGAALGLRVADGIGKGLKNAPRDALVASSVDRKRLGSAFGVQRMLDTLGSFVGPLITVALLQLWVHHPHKYRLVFLTAGIIAALPLVIIGFLVRERAVPVKKQALSFAVIKGRFGWFLGIMLLFTLGNSSDAFIILRAQDVGVSVVLIPVIYACFNLVSASTAIPAGKLADRIGRRRVIGYGWGIYALTYAGFALAHQAWMMWPLWGLYGLFYSLTEGAEKAMVAEMVPDEQRGAAYGLFSASTGLMALPASLIAGILWHRVSPAAPFTFGALMAGLAFLGLQMIPRDSVQQRAA